MEPKSIFLFSSGPRSGSTWLGKVLSRLDNTDTSIEIFNPNLNEDILNIKKTSKNHIQYVLKKIFEAKSNGKNFLFTSFLDYFNSIDILYVLSMIADVVIFNYRENILYQWISFIKSYETKEWQNTNLTNFKINWSEDNFLFFRNDCEKVFNLIRFLKKHLNIPVVNYEELHKLENDRNKIDYVNKKINQFNLNINDYTNIDLKKQNDNYNLEKCFYNYNEFIKFKNVKQFIGKI